MKIAYAIILPGHSDLFYFICWFVGWPFFRCCYLTFVGSIVYSFIAFGSGFHDYPPCADYKMYMQFLFRCEDN